MIVIAVEEDGDGIGRIRMRRIPDASAESLMPFIEDSVEGGSLVHTDGWLGYQPLKGKGYRRKITFLKGSSKTASELMPRVHLGVALLKRWLLGNPSWWSESGASGCLPRRVHVPVQPAQIAQPRQTSTACWIRQ
jgi:hypothetical protein